MASKSNRNEIFYFCVVTVKPVIFGCSVKVYAGSGSETRVGYSDCSSENVQPLPTWISQLPLTKIQVTWTSTVTLPSQMPAVSYINDGRPVAIGIVEANAIVSFVNNGLCIYINWLRLVLSFYIYYLLRIGNVWLGMSRLGPTDCPLFIQTHWRREFIN